MPPSCDCYSKFVSVALTTTSTALGASVSEEEGKINKRVVAKSREAELYLTLFNSLEGHSQKMRHAPPPSQSHLSFTQVDDKVGEILSPHPSHPPSPLNIPAAGHSIS